MGILYILKFVAESNGPNWNPHLTLYKYSWTAWRKTLSLPLLLLENQQQVDTIFIN